MVLIREKLNSLNLTQTLSQKELLSRNLDLEEKIKALTKSPIIDVELLLHFMAKKMREMYDIEMISLEDSVDLNSASVINTPDPEKDLERFQRLELFQSEQLKVYKPQDSDLIQNTGPNTSKTDANSSEKKTQPRTVEKILGPKGQEVDISSNQNSQSKPKKFVAGSILQMKKSLKKIQKMEPSNLDGFGSMKIEQARIHQDLSYLINNLPSILNKETSDALIKPAIKFNPIDGTNDTKSRDQNEETFETEDVGSKNKNAYLQLEKYLCEDRLDDGIENTGGGVTYESNLLTSSTHVQNKNSLMANNLDGHNQQKRALTEFNQIVVQKDSNNLEKINELIDGTSLTSRVGTQGPRKLLHTEIPQSIKGTVYQPSNLYSLLHIEQQRSFPSSYRADLKATTKEKEKILSELMFMNIETNRSRAVYDLQFKQFIDKNPERAQQYQKPKEKSRSQGSNLLKKEKKGENEPCETLPSNKSHGRGKLLGIISRSNQLSRRNTQEKLDSYTPEDIERKATEKTRQSVECSSIQINTLPPIQNIARNSMQRSSSIDNSKLIIRNGKHHLLSEPAFLNQERMERNGDENPQKKRIKEVSLSKLNLAQEVNLETDFSQIQENLNSNKFKSPKKNDNIHFSSNYSNQSLYLLKPRPTLDPKLNNKSHLIEQNSQLVKQLKSEVVHPKNSYDKTFRGVEKSINNLANNQNFQKNQTLMFNTYDHQIRNSYQPHRGKFATLF